MRAVSVCTHVHPYCVIRSGWGNALISQTPLCMCWQWCHTVCVSASQAIGLRRLSLLTHSSLLFPSPSLIFPSFVGLLLWSGSLRSGQGTCGKYVCVGVAAGGGVCWGGSSSVRIARPGWGNADRGGALRLLDNYQWRAFENCTSCC